MMGKTFQWEARYTVLSIIFVVQIVSFMDRMAMSVAIPYIAVDYALSPLAMGVVLSAFFASYSISQIPGGFLADRFGARRVATVAMMWWSAFTAITGAAGNLTQMLMARFCFGLGEGVYPACAFKTIAVWFPRKERATATAVMLASSALGTALAPLAVVRIVTHWGWRTVFYSLFLPGILVALLFWIFIPDKPSESSPVSPEKTGFAGILRQPTVLKCFFVLFTFDIAFWGFTTWLPTYLVKARGFSTVEMGAAASLPFFAGAVGSIVGGSVSDRYFSNNRRIPILATQLVSALLLYLTFTASSVNTLLICQTLAGFCLMFFFPAFWALPMNTVPKELMGVASGFINMAGQVAAFITPVSIGYLVGAAGGTFDMTFMLLIVCVLASCAIALTLPSSITSMNSTR